MPGRSRRDEQVSATREALLDASERLFAEYGVHAVTIRQISQAAGQGNTAAVSYHFGTKEDVVRAIAQRHAERMEVLRVRLLASIGGSTDLRDWVACAVRSVTGHLETQTHPEDIQPLGVPLGDGAHHVLLGAEVIADRGGVALSGRLTDLADGDRVHPVLGEKPLRRVEKRLSRRTDL